MDYIKAYFDFENSLIRNNLDFDDENETNETILGKQYIQDAFNKVDWNNILNSVQSSLTDFTTRQPTVTSKISEVPSTGRPVEKGQVKVKGQLPIEIKLEKCKTGHDIKGYTQLSENLRNDVNKNDIECEYYYEYETELLNKKK